MITADQITIEWRSPDKQKELCDSGQSKDEPLPYDVLVATVPIIFTKTSFDHRGYSPQEAFRARLEIERRARVMLMRHIYSNLQEARDGFMELREFVNLHCSGPGRVVIDDKFAALDKLFASVP